MATTSVRVRSASGAAATTSHTIAMPAGVQPNDQLVVAVVNDVATTTASTSSTGWGLFGSQAQGTGSNHNMTVFTKIATGSDTLTVALTTSQAARWAIVAGIGFSGTGGIGFGNGGSATTGTVSSFSSLSGNYLSLIFLGLDNSVGTTHTVTPPSGYANLTTSGGSSDPVFVAVMDQDFTAVTAVTPANVTWTNAEQWITGHVLLVPGIAPNRIPTRPRSRRLAALLDM